MVRALGQPTPDRILVIAQAFRHGLSVEEVNAACSYEPWFLRQIADIVREEGHHGMKGKGVGEEVLIAGIEVHARNCRRIEG